MRGRFAATPAGSVDWFGCDLPGDGDLHSWTDYMQRAVRRCSAPGAGTIVASGGAARVVASTAYDHRFPVVDGSRSPDGSATIQLQGTVTYTMPPTASTRRSATCVKIAAGGQTGTVFADGPLEAAQHGRRRLHHPAQTYANEPVLTLDLAGITPVTADGVKRWVHVPARIAAGTTRIGGGVYAAGQRRGARSRSRSRRKRPDDPRTAFAPRRSPSSRSRRRRPRRRAPSARAAATGSLTLTVSARADRALDARGVTVRATGKATRSGRRVTLPLAGGDATALKTAGTLQLRAGKRRVTLGSPRWSSAPTRASPRCSAAAARRCSRSPWPRSRPRAA